MSLGTSASCPLRPPSKDCTTASGPGEQVKGQQHGLVCLLPVCLSDPCSAVLICAWAEDGADALGPDGHLVHSDAFPPETLVDTLGAGDTFNAAVIHKLSTGETR